MDAFRTDASLKPHLSWLDGAAPVPSDGAADVPLQHSDFADWQLVARGPSLARTKYDDTIDAWIWQRRGEPGAMWLGLGATSPPELFFRADDPARLSALLERFFLHPPQRGKPDRVFEAFVGITPTMREIENRLALDIFTRTIPLLLGTAATAEHPSPEEELQVIQTTFVTRHSTSAISVFGWRGSLCDLEGRIVTVRVQYGAAPDEEIVRRYNLVHGTALPDDLPVDVIGALYGLPNLSPRLIEREIREGKEPTFMLALLALTLAYDSERAQAAMRTWSLHPRADLSRLAEELLGWLSQLPYEGGYSPSQ
jgi:hypothetical protein